MDTTQEEFDSLARRVEDAARRNPQAYKLKVLMLALAGYAYLFFVLALLLTLASLLLWGFISGRGLNGITVKIEIALLVFAYIVARSMWVRLPPPEGLPLTGRRAPALFETVGEIKRTVDGPDVHAVLLTEEFNASVVQIPRFGLFGWPRNYLVIGLPLMYALSPTQFRAVLAHEFGHLAGAHGRFGSWIYRIRVTWYQLMEALEGRQHWGSFLFNRFFRWYVPFFGAYSFVLARSHEYQADLCAAEAVGAREAADALISVEVNGVHLAEKFWSDHYDKVKNQSDAPAPYTEMAKSLRAGVRSDEAQRWLNDALTAETGSADTHPSLNDRLAALGQAPRLPDPVIESAAQFYLKEALAGLTEELNVLWMERVGADWEEQHRHVETARQELTELNRKAGAESLTIEEAYRRACLIEEFENSEMALPLYREVLRLNENHAAANFAVGRILMSQSGDEGVPFVERAMETDADYIFAGCEIMRRHLVGKGELVAAEKYRRRASQHAQVYEMAQAERAGLSFVDTYVSHNFSDEEVERLRQQLMGYGEIKEAYLVRKELKYFPEKPLYALGVRLDLPWHKQAGDKESEFIQHLVSAVRVPGELYCVALNSENKRMLKIMRDVSGSLIYGRQ
ncbi:MAG: M48 family metallopeptidase [Acidobacteriota bacterium]|nr:M48 family metallopeptidase [Acidobacteriota bacterium]